MTRVQMEAAIERGVDLVTPTRRRPFRVTASDYGLESDVSTGRRRRTPWHGPAHRRFGVVELYSRSRADGSPASTRWVNAEMEREGVGTRNASYILATFEFLGRAA